LINLHVFGRFSTIINFSMTPVFDGPSESKWYWGKHRRQSDVWRNCILNKSWTHFITVVYSEHLSLSLL